MAYKCNTCGGEYDMPGAHDRLDCVTRLRSQLARIRTAWAALNARPAALMSSEERDRLQAEWLAAIR